MRARVFQGKIFLRDQVGVLIVGMNETLPQKEKQSGLNEFLYWHWAQLQFNNPSVHLVRLTNMCITPYLQAFLSMHCALKLRSLLAHQ